MSNKSTFNLYESNTATDSYAASGDLGFNYIASGLVTVTETITSTNTLYYPKDTITFRIVLNNTTTNILTGNVIKNSIDSGIVKIISYITTVDGMAPVPTDSVNTDLSALQIAIDVAASKNTTIDLTGTIL